jgi:hypothetical protein
MKSKETYNGWSNYDTWLVVLWLANDYDNYRKTTRLTDDDLDDLDIMSLENDYYYGDEINFDNVNLEEIKKMIKESNE